MTSNVCPCCLCLSFYNQTRQKNSSSAVGVNIRDSRLLFPWISLVLIPTAYLSQSPPHPFSPSLFTPSFFHYLVWLAVCCGSLISLPSPSPSLSVQACQCSPSFVLLFTSPKHFSTQVSQLTHWYNHSPAHMHIETHTGIHTHTPLDDVSSSFILPLFALEDNTSGFL